MPIIVHSPDDLEKRGKRAKRPTFEALRYHTGDENLGIGFSFSYLSAAGPFKIPLQVTNDRHEACMRSCMCHHPHVACAYCINK